MRTITGLERLRTDKSLQQKLTGNIALLCHSASVDENLEIAVNIFSEIYHERFTKIFGPQHGFVSDVQDNMIETDHYTHPYFRRPIYSLYSETRKPTDKMLENIDTFVIDLQDVGTRVYTYITSMCHIMQACAKRGIKVVVLDRPNPVGGEIVEGAILEEELTSFVGCMPISQRHGMTMGEVALFAKNYFSLDLDLEIVEMLNWQRSMFFKQTGLNWVNPSPNLPTPESAITFCGTVLFEGTNMSEGRGTTRSLEVVGHPDIEPYSLYEELLPILKKLEDFESFILRPTVFMPTFQKHAGSPCGGFHIHVNDPNKFKSWRLSQVLCQAFYQKNTIDFTWSTHKYEYRFDQLAIDLINGTEKVKKWVEENKSIQDLHIIENLNMSTFLNQREKVIIYE